MTPETSAYLAAANRAIANARGNLSIDIPDQAARLAYYGQFHAAQALIFERTGKVTKTHKGVGAQFHKLTKIEPGLKPGLAAQLSRAYNYKEIADYDTATATPITRSRAEEAIATAVEFINAIRHVIA
jgi:uncharacterized protein (UPF0332 family)